MLGDPGQVPSPLWAPLSSFQPPPCTCQAPDSLASDPSCPGTPSGPVGSVVGRGASLGLQWAGPRGFVPKTCLPADTRGWGQEMWTPLPTLATRTRHHHPQGLSVLFCEMSTLCLLGLLGSDHRAPPVNTAGTPLPPVVFSFL